MTTPETDPGLDAAIQRVMDERRRHEYVVLASDTDPRKVCICGHDVEDGSFWQHQAEALARAAREDVADTVQRMAGPMTLSEQRELQAAFDRDVWVHEWNSLPTAIDRVLAHRAAAIREGRD